ncbi:MAG: DUF4386 domain-containing protein [Prolixibacteraceae bacterium]|jgi:hypothetical protein|nr:DUF4386 domain-containing protein [Prolixibacteraceae bacterium]
MKSNKYTARLAGSYYFLLAIFAAFGLLFVSSQLYVEGNILQTVQNITENSALFRIGIVSRLLGQIFFVFLALELYRLFKSVDKKLSLLLFALVVVSVPIAFFNEINQIAVIQLYSGAEYLQQFNQEQLNAFTQFFLNLHAQGIILVEIFWGLWLLPLGLLVYKSGFLPKAIGVLLLIGCFSYVMEWFTQLLIPGGLAWMEEFLTYASIGEISTMFYLVIIGVKKSKLAPIID